MEILKQHKVELIKWLRGDSLILQHVQSRKMISMDEYTTLMSIQDPTEKIVQLLDKILQKGSSSCQMFMDLLRRDDVNESCPELRQWIARLNLSGLPDDSINTAARNEDEHRQAESERLKSVIKDRYATLYEGTAAKGKHVPLSEIYTELCVVEDWRGGVNMDHEVIQIEAGSSRRADAEATIRFSEVFSGSRHVKKVLTLGIAGIGKTASVQKFALDWAEGKSNVNIDFVFILPFRELNRLKDEEYSLHDLLLHLYPELQNLKETGILYGKCKCAFIFDGLDEFRKTLDFTQRDMSAVHQKAPVDVLVKSLIAGALFRSALVWITSRPAAADQIPSDCIHLVTEVQGFVTGEQKEAYFRKRISDEEQASRIISHIKQSKTLYIMCYIPIFCWITCVVLQEILGKCNVNEMPSTLTQMYAHFLTVQMDRKSKKYNETHQKDTKKLFETEQTMLLKLAELAFKQLMEGNFIFFEEDLTGSGIDVSKASLYSDIFTKIVREESMFYQRKAYCFVHASFQEFLAAVYVFHCYEIQNLEVLGLFLSHKSQSFFSWSFSMTHNALVPTWRAQNYWKLPVMPVDQSSIDTIMMMESSVQYSVYISLDLLLVEAVQKAMESRNGHLDLFLRFLLGISLEPNQRLLQGLLNLTQSRTDLIIDHIKGKMQGDTLGFGRPVPNERYINLFLCLTEMNDQSLCREIHAYLKAEATLSPGQCSALACMLLLSEEVLEELDLKKYKTSVEGYMRLIPAVSACRKAKLAGCHLTKRSFETLCTALKSVNCSLKWLDLSNNDLQGSGVELLSAGFNNSQCKLETLRLTGCNLGTRACEYLGSALQSVNSYLKELDLSYNDLQDSGVELLSAGLESSHCKLETLRLTGCNLGTRACKFLRSALQSVNSSLKELDLSNNDLQDSGVELLSAGLESSHCKLETLSLSGCMVTEEGCSSLASALESKTSNLKKLDLTYNHPGESGVQLLSNVQRDPDCRLEELQFEYGGEMRMKPGLKKYTCDLSLDPHTAHRVLFLSEGRRKVENMQRNQFNPYQKILSVESLTGRCYWEAEWRGIVSMSVSYREYRRNEDREYWHLFCSTRTPSALIYTVRHFGNRPMLLSTPPSNRVGVYLDWAAGLLSFYSISPTSHTLTRQLTVTTRFTEPLYAAFWVFQDSSVCLCGTE